VTKIKKNKYFELDCVVGFVVVVTGFGVIGFDIGLRSTHLSSSDPSAQCLMPSHLLSLLTQAPYLHRNVYFGHLKFNNLVEHNIYCI